MPTFRLETLIAVPQSRLWDFHADPEAALPRLTPPGKRVRVVRVDRPQQAGAHVVLRVRLLPGVWATWDALIEIHEPPLRFVDVQQRGPFARWRHEHRFEAVDDGHSRLVDEVDYAAPLGPLGRLVEWAAINRDVAAMFAYRHRVTRAILEGAGGP